MGQPFVPGHMTLVAIGEGERDRLGQILWRDAAKVIEIPLIGRCYGSAQRAQGWRIVRVVGSIAMPNVD
ncbi:hypothetical protein [Rhizobium mongolense]|uniref:Uncharacterized protein n=1 Tax=Rhizobium mongolense TaxID=57676 RepID=A0A7W6RVH0_9HYPH|nr:hypothetical protein [Rhizobium mongolense]MBB4279402.1 hypothetical protein [Rhizobium mongolense]